MLDLCLKKCMMMGMIKLLIVFMCFSATATKDIENIAFQVPVQVYKNDALFWQGDVEVERDNRLRNIDFQLIRDEKLKPTIDARGGVEHAYKIGDRIDSYFCDDLLIARAFSLQMVEVDKENASHYQAFLDCYFLNNEQCMAKVFSMPNSLIKAEADDVFINDLILCMAHFKFLTQACYSQVVSNLPSRARAIPHALGLISIYYLSLFPFLGKGFCAQSETCLQNNLNYCICFLVQSL